MAIQTFWDVKHYRNNELIWEDIHRKNSLAYQGALAILQVYYQGATFLTISNTSYPIPTNFYVRLCNYSPLFTDTLTTIENEAVGNGYTPQVVPASGVGFPVIDTAGDGNPRLTSQIVTFTASGGAIGPVITAFIASSSDNTGILQGFLPLSMQRTILANDSMTYQFYIEEGN